MANFIGRQRHTHATKGKKFSLPHRPLGHPRDSKLGKDSKASLDRGYTKASKSNDVDAPPVYVPCPAYVLTVNLSKRKSANEAVFEEAPAYEAPVTLAPVMENPTEEISLDDQIWELLGESALDEVSVTHASVKETSVKGAPSKKRKWSEVAVATKVKISGKKIKFDHYADKAVDVMWKEIYEECLFRFWDKNDDATLKMSMLMSPRNKFNGGMTFEEASKKHSTFKTWDEDETMKAIERHYIL